MLNNDWILLQLAKDRYNDLLQTSGARSVKPRSYSTAFSTSARVQLAGKTIDYHRPTPAVVSQNGRHDCGAAFSTPRSINQILKTEADL